MVDQSVAEAGIVHALGQGHADGGAEPLAEGTGGHLDAARGAIFGMTGSPRAELAKPLDLVQRHILITGEVEQSVQQHGAVTRRQHEAVTIMPIGRARVELEMAGEQNRGRVGHARGHAGMARIGGLHCIHSKRANGVGHMGVFDQRLTSLKDSRLLS